MRRACVCFAIAVAVALTTVRSTTAVGALQNTGPGGTTAAPTRATAAALAPRPSAALLQQYCVSCHSDRLKTGGLSLSGLDPADVAAHTETWEKVALKLRGRMMPPQGMPRPDDATLEAFTAALEGALDEQASRTPDPGHKPVHRLNRTEYGNAVRDLLDLTVDATELLPPDDESNGFDNMAGVLKVSPSLLEQYLAAARTVSSLAVGTASDLGQWTYRVPPDTEQADHVDGLPLGTRGGLLIRHNFPQDADYDFSVLLLRNIVGYMTGLEFAHQVEVSIDGERVFVAQVGGDEDNLASDTNMSAAADRIDARLKTRVAVQAGPRLVGVTFVHRNNAESDEPLQSHRRDHDLQNMNGLPKIDVVKIQGPYNALGAGDTPSRRRVFTCRPAGAAEEMACARTILSTVARRAYRRPVTAADVQPLIEMYGAGRKKGSFDAGIEQGLRLVLANPKFLFRTEAVQPPARSVAQNVAGVGADGLRRVTDLELASRLSFFLWSSHPG